VRETEGECGKKEGRGIGGKGRGEREKEG